MDLYKTKTMKFTTMAAAVALLALGATEATADGVNGGSAVGSVTVAVDNTVTVTQTTAINFGSMVIITDGTGGNIDIAMSNASVVTWPGVAAQAAPWIPSGGAANIGTGPKARAFPTGVGAAAAAGVFTITGVAAGASMGIIYNNTAVNNKITLGGAGVTTLTCAACALGAEPLMTFGTITDNTAAGILTDGDSDGTMVLNVGGTLRVANAIDSMNLTGSSTAVVGALEDGTYTGTFTVSAIY